MSASVSTALVLVRFVSLLLQASNLFFPVSFDGIICRGTGYRCLVQSTPLRWGLQQRGMQQRDIIGAVSILPLHRKRFTLHLLRMLGLALRLLLGLLRCFRHRRRRQHRQQNRQLPR